MNVTAGTLDDLRHALRDRIEALAETLLGERSATSTRRTLRFGSKGSVAVELAGRKRGAWFSHEAGEGGGPIELIRHAHGCSHEAAVAWARNWIGQAEEAPRPRPRRPADDTSADSERQAKIDHARRLWMEAGPIAGTLGERYLVDTRCIPAPPGGWPGMAARYHGGLRAIILAATRDDGAVQAVQRVFLTPDAKNQKNEAGKSDKRSLGPQDGALVRLPGDPAGPLLVAEGPETGLSVWRATGAETWIALGSMTKAELPTGRRVVICADDDPRRAIPGKPANAAKQLGQAVARWRKGGVDLVVAYPWPIRRGDKSDHNDAMQADGIEAVRARIEAALNPPAPTVARVSVKQARAELAAKVGGFMDAAAAWTPPGDDGTDDDAPPPPALPPPVHAIRVDVGAGKSDAARRGLVRLVAELRAKGDGRNVAIAVPTHALGGEQAQKLIDMPEARAAGLTVRVWKGRDAADPDAPGQAMCRDLPAVALAQDLALDVQTTVCRKRLRDGTVAACPFFTSCGYQRQREATADIWIAAHQLLFTRKQGTLGELAAVVVDESFGQAGLVPETAIPVDALDPATLPDDLALDPLPSLRAIALDVLRTHGDGPLLRERFLATGLSEESAILARRLELKRQVIPPELVPGMSAEARKAAASAARGNRLVLRLARFWQALRALLADGGPEASGWLALDRDDDDVRVVRQKGRRDVAKGWRVPTLILDATLRLELVRPFYPSAELVADLAVAAPHQRVRQVTDRAYSLAMLDPNPETQSPPKKRLDDEERRRRQNRLRDLRVTIDTEARRVRPRRLLVVAQERIEAALHAMGSLPPNVVTGHHNAVAGRDEWRDVGGIMVIGRTMPAPGSVNGLAEALSGSHVPLLDGWYQRADTTRETVAGAELAEADRHPDPLAEAIRWTICEGQLLQIIGRGRGVNRTARDPLDVLVLSDVPLPLPVAETMPAATLDPTQPARMLAEGGVALENSGHAFQAYRRLWPSSDAARQAFLREKSATFPYEESQLGKCRSLRRVAYQVARQGQRAAVAWFDPLVVPDPEAWLADRLGPLAWCRPDELVPVVPGCMAELPPEVIHTPPPPVPPPPDLFLTPAELMTVRGRGHQPIALIEAPRRGPVMGARAVTPAGPGPWLLLARPPDPDDDDVVVPHPAFLAVGVGHFEAGRRLRD